MFTLKDGLEISIFDNYKSKENLICSGTCFSSDNGKTFSVINQKIETVGTKANISLEDVTDLIEMFFLQSDKVESYTTKELSGVIDGFLITIMNHKH